MVFAAAAVVAAAGLSARSMMQKLPAWRQADTAYQEIGTWLHMQRVPAGMTVMVGNPPGFYYHTGIQAVVVPNGDLETLLAVADRYQVAYVVLDQNRPHGLEDLETDARKAGLELVAIFGDGQVQLYRRARTSQEQGTFFSLEVSDWLPRTMAMSGVGSAVCLSVQACWPCASVASLSL